MWSVRHGGLRSPASADLYTAGKRNITFKSGSEEVPGFYVSKLQHAYSGVVVVPEWWGLNTSIQKTAESIGNSNFRTLVPDLYRGKVAKDNEEAGHLMNSLDFMRAIDDIRGAAVHLLESGVKRVGVIGFGMGGALVTAASSIDNPIKELSCGIVFHGVPDLTKLNAANIKLPLQCHFGMRDNLKGFSDPETAEKFEKWLKAAELQYTFYRYERAGHAFTNQDRPEVYNEYASKLAWMRAFAWFNKHLNMPTFEEIAKEREAKEKAAKEAKEAAAGPYVPPPMPGTVPPPPKDAAIPTSPPTKS